MSARKLLLLQKLANYQRNQIIKRYSHNGSGGVPGENLPFGKSIGRPGKLTFLFILFFGSGFWVPSIAFIYMMHK